MKATVLVLTSLAFVSPLRAEPVQDRVDPKVMRAIRTGLRGGPVVGMVVPRPGRVPVLLELDRPAEAAWLARLGRTAGVRLHLVEGRPLAYRHLVPAIVDRQALSAISHLAEVKRVSLVPARGPLPLDHSAGLIGLAAARGARPAQDLLTGAGVLIGDIDSNADIFHPHFFRPDAGYYDWIDRDGDGVLTPGVDVIDFNRDWVADPTKTAALLRGDLLYAFYGMATTARPAKGFDPAIDWLYIDNNGNRQRDFGAAAGFDDQAPALGEPLFVPDDVNRNGKLDLGERLLRLGSSKLRKVYVYLKDIPGVDDVDHVFQRGVDFSRLKVDYTHGTVYGFSDALHATGVLSIVAGDVVLPGRRFVGMAPEAELVLGYELSSLPTVTTTWALGEKPAVMLYELCPWIGVALDGSDPLSSLIDSSATADQVSHTCPVGDQAGARKHMFLDLPAKFSLAVPFSNPQLAADQTYIELSLHLRGAGRSGSVATLVEPGGQSHPLRDGEGTLSSGAYIYIGSENTPRQTRILDVILYTDNPKPRPIPLGEWKVTLTGDPAGATTVDGFLFDALSGFAEGVGWPAASPQTTDRSTLGVPSTADHCVAIAAHTGHPHTSREPWFDDYPPGGAGAVRDYSPWGPRIDGVEKPDIAAPDNPWVAAPHDTAWGVDEKMVYPHGALWPFGGTSGAAPHVTGVAALLAQAGVRGQAARDAIRRGAIVDVVTGAVPNIRYGYGRLSAAGALGVAAASDPPGLSLTASTTRPAVGEEVILTPVAVDPGGGAALEIKWDDGYDGSWDVGYAPLAPRRVTASARGRQGYKARVRNPAGLIADAVVWLDVGAPPPDGLAPADGTAGDGVAGDWGSGGDRGWGEVGSGCACAVGAVLPPPSRPGLLGLGLLVLLAGIGTPLVRRRCRRSRRPDPGLGS